MNTSRWSKELGFIGGEVLYPDDPVLPIKEIREACRGIGTRVIVATTVPGTNRASLKNLRAVGFKPFARGRRQPGCGSGLITLWRKLSRGRDGRTDYPDVTFCCGLVYDDGWNGARCMTIFEKKSTAPLSKGYKVLKLAKGYWLTGMPAK